MFETLRKEVGEILGRVCKMEEVTYNKSSNKSSNASGSCTHV